MTWSWGLSNVMQLAEQAITAAAKGAHKVQQLVIWMRKCLFYPQEDPLQPAIHLWLEGAHTKGDTAPKGCYCHWLACMWLSFQAQLGRCNGKPSQGS